MKQFLATLFCLFAISVSAQKNTFKDFYKSHKKEADVSLNIPGFIAGWFIEDQDEEIDALLAKAKNYKILVFDSNSNAVQEDFKKFVKKNKLKTLIRVKDEGDRVAIHFKENDNNLIREIIVNVYSQEEDTVMLGLKTKLTVEELSAIVGSVNTNSKAK